MRIILLFLLFSSYAQAGNFTLGVGYSHFQKAPSGNWYDEKYSHDLNMDSPSATIRYDFDDISVGYMYTGKVTSNALARASDSAYSANSPYPLSSFYGTGHSEGFFLSKRFGSEYYFSGGLMVYRSTWEMVVPDFRPTIDSPPQYLKVDHKPSWMILPMVGLGYTKGKYALELNLIPVKTYGDEYPAIYRGYATNLSVLYKF